MNRFIQKLACGVIAGLLASAAFAQGKPYPTRPVTMVVANAAGGAVDAAVRVLIPAIQQHFGGTIVIENKVGLGGHIGSSYVAKAAPDGYTILATTGSILSGVQQNLNYDPANDLAPIGRMVSTGMVLVVPGTSPFHNLNELIAYAKANPGKLNYGTPGPGNASHLAAEMLNMLGSVQTTPVHYRGSPQSLMDLIGARTDFSFDRKAGALEFIKSGRLRVLAVTNIERQADMPGVPTTNEELPGLQFEGWLGLFAPKGTDKAIIARMAAALKASLADPATQQKLAVIVGQAAYLAPEDTARLMTADRTRMEKVVRAANIKSE